MRLAGGQHLCELHFTHRKLSGLLDRVSGSLVGGGGCGRS